MACFTVMYTQKFPAGLLFYWREQCTNQVIWKLKVPDIFIFMSGMLLQHKKQVFNFENYHQKVFLGENVLLMLLLMVRQW